MDPLKEKIGILGEGITAKAVHDTLQKLHIPTVPIDQATLLIASPGIAPKNYPATSATVISEIDLAYLLFKRLKHLPTLIAVTGTNGKTTVTSLLAHILEAPAYGNIGIPLIVAVAQDPPPPTIVVELSSYQLEQSHYFTPHISLILNITPDHLERHTTMQEYAAQKAKIIAHSTPDDVIIYLDTDPYILSAIAPYPATKIPYSLSHPIAKKLSTIQLKGPHNLENALAAYLAAKHYGLPEELIIQKIHTFTAVEHRIEPIPNSLGIDIYNDSKATNPEATMVAIRAFTHPIHLILCGFDKQLPLEPMIHLILTTVKTITLFGDIRPRFMTKFKEIAPHSTLPIFQCDTLSQAIAHTLSIAQKSDVILFSPSNSSFDQFKNYEDRGRQFKQEVLRQLERPQ